MRVDVVYRGRKFYVSLDSDPTVATLADLGAALVDATGCSLNTQKLLRTNSYSSNTEKLRQHGMTSNRRERGAAPALHLCDPTQASLTLFEAGISEGSRLMLLGSSAHDVQAVHAEEIVDPRIRGFDDGFMREMQRRTLGVGPRSVDAPAYSQYSFSEFKVLRWPGMMPPPSEAESLLFKVAGDPGIKAIMEKHRWSVGLLSEMPPEGKVGVSEVCVLGYNKNKGEEISLRLRTDDMKGFRKYSVILKTVLHELAHMVHSDHDNDFKALDSQLNKEYVQLNWAMAEKHTASGAGPALEYDHSAELTDVMSLTKRSSGMRLGGGEGGNARRDAGPGRAAGVAAIARHPPPPPPEEPAGEPLRPRGTKRIVDGMHFRGCACGCDEGSMSDLNSTGADSTRQPLDGAPEQAPSTELALPASATTQSVPPLGPAVSCALLHVDAMPRGTTAAPTTNSATTSILLPVPASMDPEFEVEGAPLPGAATGGGGAFSTDVHSSARFATNERAADPMEMGESIVHEKTGMEVSTEARAKDTTSSGQTQDGCTASPMPSSMHIVSDDVEHAHEADALVASFSKETCSGTVPTVPPSTVERGEDGAACDDSEAKESARDLDMDESEPPVVRGPDDRAAIAEAAESVLLNNKEWTETEKGVAMEVDPAIAAMQESGSAAEKKAEQGMQRLVAAADTADALVALRTIHQILQNVMKHPNEEKYRRLRWANATVSNRVRRFPGAVDILKAAGFQDDEGADPGLRFARNDVALLWLVSHTVQTGLGAVQEMISLAN
mmetsp:Transcript_28966/g.55463  ORF Transcript_28966/g.55463 Transcript_28966/m.55463 type:complete len:781 (+) Transcript_28966:105-2447(+)